MPYADKEKQRNFQRVWIHARRVEFFSDKRCAWCNSMEKLELHHVNPDEKVSHRIWSWSESKRGAEIEKCIVLCNECHKHIKKIPEGVHGLVQVYQRGCRCRECKNAQNERMRDYRFRKANCLV